MVCEHSGDHSSVLFSTYIDIANCSTSDQVHKLVAKYKIAELEKNK